jgi:large subunit ribosomal protein L13e
VRAGRGFSIAELKKAGISKKKAGTIGIAVDHRRSNKSTEGMLVNVERLKAYMGNLVVFPKKGKGAAPAIAQLQGTVMPIVQPAIDIASRAITADEKQAGVFRDMRIGRADARNVGIRQKKADAAAAAAALAKKK